MYGFVEALHFALLVEEAVLVALGDEEIELEVAAGELHTAGDRGPLAEDDGLVLGGAVGEGVAADDVLLEHIAEREAVGTFFHHTALQHLTVSRHHTTLRHHTALRLYGVTCASRVQPLRGWVLGEDVGLQSGAAGFGIVGEDVDAVAGADGDEALELPVGLGFDILQKAAVEPERLVAHEVEHSVHLARIGEHLAMVSHPLAAFDLFCVFVVGHKKIVELCLCPLRCSTTCPTIK